MQHTLPVKMKAIKHSIKRDWPCLLLLESTRMMKRLRDIAAWYLAIGLLVGANAWFSDPYSSATELILIPVIAVLWPLWLLIQLGTG